MCDENKCAICWEEIGEKNKSVMNCGIHSFHFSCITTNILKGNGDQSMNCPLCRELIVDKEFEDYLQKLFMTMIRIPFQNWKKMKKMMDILYGKEHKCGDVI